jgi:hypothetical protein
MDYLPMTRRPRIADAIRIVAAEYGMTEAVIRSPIRTHEVALARHFAMWVARKATSLSLPIIGREFGGRDHTTVIYALSRVDAIRERDPVIAATLDRLAKAVWDMAPVRQTPAAEEILAGTPSLRPTRISATISGDLAAWVGMGGTFEVTA